MESKLRIIYNLLFKKTDYIKVSKAIEPRTVYLSDKNITIFRDVLDVIRSEAMIYNRPPESYIREVRQKICDCPEFMNAIEVECRELIGENKIRFEAELKVII